MELTNININNFTSHFVWFGVSHARTHAQREREREGGGKKEVSMTTGRLNQKPVKFDISLHLFY